MKTTRTFASVCLTASCIALVAAANVSVGDQPGVFQMTTAPQDGTSGGVENGIVPVPDGSVPNGNGNDPAGQVNLNGGDSAGQVTLDGGTNVVITDPSQFLGTSAGVTSPVFAPQVFQHNLLIAPQLTFEQNIDDSIGMQDSYTRFNAFIPNHLVPDSTILAMSLSASLSEDGDDLYNWGAIYRHYDPFRNRIFGVNLFGDFDSTPQLDEYSRIGFGIESLGRYIDFIFNGYVNTGADTTLSSRTPLTGLTLAGNGVVRSFSELRENAYEGLDWKIGTPLPWLGRRGLKAFLGSYYLASEYGSKEALGVSVQFMAQVTESLEVNAFYTNDEVFGDNSWVSVAYSIPQTRQKRIMRPKTVRERLADPVRRTNTIHTKVERSTLTVSEINTKTGMPWNIVYVDPNATAMGIGTLESPYMTLQAAVDANDATVDAIRVTPRADGTGTNLTALGGIDLFDEQSLFSSHKDFVLFEDAGSSFVIPAASTSADGPLVSDPSIMAGDSVIRIADWNRISGLQINASNAGGTAYGIGVSAPAPFDSVQLICNTFTNYTVGASLPDGSGELLFDENTFEGLSGTSTVGLMLSTEAGSTSDLRVRENTATNNSVAGLYVRAKTGATIDAEDLVGVSGPVTGVVDNETSNNGDGIVLTGEAGATLNIAAENNTSTENNVNGFVARVDGAGALFNLSSLRGNTFTMNGENGAFLHYLNGADFRSVTEDADGDGILGPGEDLNGNGILDQGIVSNVMSDNVITGMCIFGEGDPAVDDSGTGGDGVFDIGGPVADLGNVFIGNLGAGIAVDVQDSATYQADTLFNTISSGTAVAASTAPTLTIVLDFWEASQGTLTDPFGFDITPFDVTGFGFAAADYDMVTNAVLDTVREHYYGIPTVGVDSRSPLADGQQLDIDFVIGDIGTAPSNGATEYYYTVIGGSSNAPDGLAGIALGSSVRNATGGGPNGGTTNADLVSSTFSDSINSLTGLTPADIPDLDGDVLSVGENNALLDALTSGNLTFTRNALAGTISHEVGHTLSLDHLNVAGSVTPSGAPPIMGTGAIDLPNQARIGLREFAYSGQNAQAGNATQMQVQQLINALGTRSALQTGVSGDGITIVGNDSAVMEESTFFNNTITNNGGDALSIQMNDAARAEGVTIQTNVIQNNTGRGVNLEANGATAFINASNTIGGSGMNTLGGVSYTQSNLINGNQGDGIRALASMGGTIFGNAISNTITNNAGNGIALLIEQGGTIDFGTPASNRLITGNTITGNGGAGILAISTVDTTVSNTEQEMNLVIQGNTISQNVSGGIVAELNGVNNGPPGPPAIGFDENNVLNLVIGQSTMPFGTPVDAELNTINQNGSVGIGVVVNGTGLANVSIVGNTITNTTAGTDPIFNGDGIGLIRRDSSLLLADVFYNTATGNASNGMEVDTQGTDKTNINQPMTGTVNSVTWNNNIFSSNGENGASFATRGDSQLFGNGANNVVMSNTRSGVLVTTSENSSFGDPTLVGDARRTMFTGLTATMNGRDGVELFATEQSQLMLEITAARVATASGAHAALNTMGDSSISMNGRDGIHIESSEAALPNILIQSEGALGSGLGLTVLSGNGTAGSGGNGIFWDSYDSAAGIVQVYDTLIIDNIAGASEDTNGDGLLTFDEDTDGNFDQNQIDDTPTEDELTLPETSGNLDIDVANGDGIQFNYFHNTTSSLIVGAAGRSNWIQGNQDDGIALTGDVTRISEDVDPFGVTEISAIRFNGLQPEPTILISNNLIGGERDGLPAGNLGDGVSIRNFGHTEVGVMPGDVDADLDDGDGFDPSGSSNPAFYDGGGAADLIGNFTDGPIPDITLVDNTITRNSRIGVNIRLQGGAGRFNLRSTPVNTDPVAVNTEDYLRITLTGNTIASNGEEGVFLRADSDMNQNRIVFTQNLNDGEDNFDVNTHDPFGVDAQSAFPADDVDGSLPYLNLATVQNTLFTVTGNTIQNNGTNTINGEGIEIRVGTGAYVAADIRDNIFGGNLEEDLATGAFYSNIDLTAGGRVDAFDSVDNDGEFLYDIVYLDDAALLDMRFTGNSGNQINPLEEAAFFLDIGFNGGDIAQDVSAVYEDEDNTDPIKGDLRGAGVFKIDDYFFGLDAPNNNFIEFGATQSISGAFATYTILNFSAESPWPEDPFQDAD